MGFSAMVTDTSPGAVWQGMNAVPEHLADSSARAAHPFALGTRPTGLVQVLREVQEEFGCLPRPALALIAAAAAHPRTRG